MVSFYDGAPPQDGAAFAGSSVIFGIQDNIELVIRQFDLSLDASIFFKQI
ncbi:hypothetical protein MLPF_2588 [Mycobacterium lepromatosis]|nr:hypothetical protein MLPF_2588 [Mycobacterium lepromatosis]